MQVDPWWNLTSGQVGSAEILKQPAGTSGSTNVT